MRNYFEIHYNKIKYPIDSEKSRGLRNAQLGAIQRKGCSYCHYAYGIRKNSGTYVGSIFNPKTTGIGCYAEQNGSWTNCRGFF